MNPIKASLRHSQVTFLLVALAALAGLHALFTMPRREDPLITIRNGLVSAAYPGATSEQVEKQVTRQIENLLFEYAEVDRSDTYSTTYAATVVVNVALQDWVKDTDQFWSKVTLALDTLRVTQLPPGVRGPVVNSDFGDVVAILLAVQGDRYGYRDLSNFLDEIQDAMQGLSTVSKIDRIGEQNEQIYLTGSTQVLSQYGVTPDQVVQVLQSMNTIAGAGAFEADMAEVPLVPDALYQTEEQIRRQIIGAAPTGQPILLGDLARVQRRYEEPSYVVRVNGAPAVLLSLQMQQGNNIVDFGHAIDGRLEELRDQLPPDLQVTRIVNQPEVVVEAVNEFLREFGIAIASVILVTIILLPIRVAAIAATAIPITIAVTFAVLNGLGIELQQVSLAGLIVVLGMVVDDAIIIADNYVQKLDEGLSSEEAAWRAPSELASPALTATITIIASFVPLAFLPGSTGEFIRALPITVAVALSTSYAVAMLVTPRLCLTFIKKGLKASGVEESARFKPLRLMEAGYRHGIAIADRHRASTIVLGIVAVLAGGWMFRHVKPEFFPAADRAQFAISVWLPQGSRFTTTDAAVRRIEVALAEDPEVTSYASFVGGGAPRFYYAFNPYQRGLNVAQMIVNTRSVGATPRVLSRLRTELPALTPEAQVVARALQQGQPVLSPIEVRISGDDIPILKRFGDDVVRILETTEGSALVHTDYREDAYSLAIAIDPDVANRVGLTNVGIAQKLAGSFLGAPVSTYWEGHRAIDIVLRLDPESRRSFEDVADIFLTSPVTGAKVPLRQVATIGPVWETGRIVRRAGVRTLTVGSWMKEDVLSQQVVDRIEPAIAGLDLPVGYSIAWGGEYDNRKTAFQNLTAALGVGLLLILVIIMFEFRRLIDTTVVMLSIPLALFGAMFGLLLTSNPFSFTAFVGLVSLAGITVRNAIILIDYVREKREEGESVERAALDAGERRLRPIFLTTMAAAAGLTPMMLSGSALWSPMAAVIAFGLLFAMAFTLVVVPILYILVERPRSAAQQA